MTTQNGSVSWGRARKALEAEIWALGALRRERRAFEKVLTILAATKGTILVSGIGKSAHVGFKIASTLTSLGHKSAFLDPVHALHGDAGFVSPGDVLIAISYSGSSAEVIKIVEHLKKEFKVTVVAFTGKPTSPLARLADAVMPLPIKHEGSPLNLAPMASTTVTLALGDMFAAALTDPETFEKEQFARFHPGGRLGLLSQKIEARMIKGVPVVSEKAPFMRALAESSKHKKGIVGVRNKMGKLVGVITDGDVRRFVMSHPDTKNATAKLAMSKKPKTISISATLEEALDMMEKYKITVLFVARNGKSVGMIHMHDILS